jgi:formylglycine-generating enzyme required for sulfatase activity
MMIAVVILTIHAAFGAELSLSTAVSADMVTLPDGVHRPLFVGPGELNTVPVKRFRLDRLPVTNGDFLDFIRANPRWRRSQVKRLFADEQYLTHWADDLELGVRTQTNQPVVWVSWFAAKAYAQWKGKRLPTVAEWEYAASASASRPDGENDPEFQRALRRWYSMPSPAALPQIGAGPANCFGVLDLHGLIWEWTSDFNSSLVTGDARGDSGIERQLFCGAGSAGAKDTANFPAFMRYGFRSSLKAAYTVHNLGFRCAKDL